MPLRFFRAGGLDQIRLDTAADLAAIPELDQKLWVALACPVKGLEIDDASLACLDGDADGRVRAPDVIKAIKFLQDRLASLDQVIARKDSLIASDLKNSPATSTLLAALGEAQRLAKKGPGEAISIKDADDAVTAAKADPFNGDAILVPESAPEGALRNALSDLLSLYPGSDDRSGKKGASEKDVENFLAALAAWKTWEDAADTKVMILGDLTAAAAAAVSKVQSKIDDHFARCRMAAFDPRAAAALGLDEAAIKALATQALGADSASIAALPLAAVDANGILHLDKGINPAWAAAIASFRSSAAEGKNVLTEAEWNAIKNRFDAYAKWLAAKPAFDCSKLSPERRANALTSKDGLAALFAQDKAAAPRYDALSDLVKTLRLQRDLYRLVKNFVNFADFYAPGCDAVFRVGTLYIDARACSLCLRVDDAGKHASLAGLAKGYLAYVDCTRKDKSAEKISIVALFGAGDGDNLMAGRNGIFYDRQGRDWDATITKIVDNPISIRQAFWSPYKKLVRMIEEQIAKRAADADAEANSKLTAAATTVAQADKKAADEKKPAPKIELATLALIGTVISGIAAVIGGLLQALFGLGILMPLGVVGIMLAVSGPSMLIAALKLRQRNIGPLLDANGWAINSRVRVTFPVGASMTKLAAVPQGAELSLVDPYAEKKSIWPKLIGFATSVLTLLVGAIALFFMLYHQNWLGKQNTHAIYHLGLPGLGIPHTLIKERTEAEQARDAFITKTTELVNGALVTHEAKLIAAEARYKSAQEAHSKLQEEKAGLELFNKHPPAQRKLKAMINSIARAEIQENRAKTALDEIDKKYTDAENAFSAIDKLVLEIEKEEIPKD
ncbi:MAG: hypothetical protein RL095_1276 [Verrucomicrobiota bacterium]|jgi:hypothetical protein